MKSRKILLPPVADGLLLLPAVLMAILPYSIENRLNISILGYDFFIFLFFAIIILFIRILQRRINLIEPLVLFLIIWSIISTAIQANDYFFARIAIGTEYILGFLFAVNMKFTHQTLRFVHYVSLLLYAFVFVQLLSFSLGLEMFSSGQNAETLTDGLLRTGTTLGGPTFTGIFLPVLVGLLVVTTHNAILKTIYITIGIVMAIFSGTRSSMLVLLLMFIYLILSFRNKKKYIFIGLVALTVAFIYIYPILKDIIEFRNEISSNTSDITSGRHERWLFMFNEMDRNPESYFLGFGGGTAPISTFNEKVKSMASPHNVYLGIILQYGFVGIIAFLFFLGRKVKMLCHNIHIGTIAVIGSLVVCWNTEVVALNFLYSFFFWLLFFITYYISSVSEGKVNSIVN